MNLKHITFTGIDAQTDLEWLKDISAQNECEWGILFSDNQQGKDPRYPEQAVIDRALRTELRFAAHLCGSLAKEVMTTGTLNMDFSGFSRIQVNHRKPDAAVLAEFSKKVGIPVIAQWRDAEVFPAIDQGISWLFDPSGGNGLRPAQWPINQSSKLVGFAGGINPDNVGEILTTLGGLSSAGFWIDMETGVRTDNWLDLKKVEAVIETAASKQ